jgi:hypothetical protein
VRVRLPAVVCGRWATQAGTSTRCPILAPLALAPGIRRHTERSFGTAAMATATKPRPCRSAGRRAFSRTVTQRHTVDRYHLEADLRSSPGWTGLLEARGSLVEVLVEAASSGGTGTSCWSWRAICGMRVRLENFTQVLNCQGEVTGHCND